MFLLTLGLIGILNGCLPVLSGPDTPARSAAIDSLAAVGAEGVAGLGQTLQEAGWRAQEGILDALTRIGPASVPLLAQAARNHPDEDTRRRAIRALGRVGGTAARDSLLILLDGGQRDIVLEALGTIGDSTVVPDVLRFLADPVSDVRRRAVVALGKMAGTGAVGQMIGALSDSHHGVRFAAAGGLETMGVPAAKALLSQVEGLPLPGRYLAIRTLGRLRYAPAGGFLTHVLRGRDWSLRAAAAEALGLLGTGDGAEALGEALRRERHPFVRERIRLSLGLLDDGVKNGVLE